MISALWDKLQQVVENAKESLTNLVDFLHNIFSENWDGAVENLGNILKNLWDGGCRASAGSVDGGESS